MDNTEFSRHLEHLGLTQSDAAASLLVTPRTVRRWQKGEQEIPGPIADLLKAWRQLADAQLPWTADIGSIWYGDNDQIRRHHDHARALATLLSRVASRGGPAAPWQVHLKDRRATLGPMTVSFYALKNGGFSLAHYRRGDINPDVLRDQSLIEDAVAAFAAAVGQARKQRPGQRWDE